MEKGTEDTSKLVQIEELKCAIEKLPFVTVLSPVRAVKGKGRGYGVTLRCPSCEEYGSCGKKQEPPVQVSSVHPTELACLQELLKRLQDRHVNCAEAVAKKAAADAASAATVDPDAPNVLQAMMLFQQAKNRAKATQDRAKAAQDEAKVANKVALQAGFGRGWRRPTMLHTSNPKKISSFGLNVPASIKKRNLSRWCG
jgi:hypothetical protein